MAHSHEARTLAVHPFARALAWLVALVLALAGLNLGTRPLGGGDVFWQLRAGEIALREGRPPDVETFSYTVAGEHWNNHEWGSEILVALLHRALGFNGLRVLAFMLAFGAVAGVGISTARRAGESLGVLVAALTFAFASYKFIPAPQTASMALFFAAWAAFRGPRVLDSPRSALALVVMMIAWGNLTAEALIFLPFLVVAQGTRLPDYARSPAPRTPVRPWLVLAVACAAPLLNPPWSSTLEYALHGSAVNRAVNAEFAHLWEPAATLPSGVKHLAQALCVLFVAYAAASLRRDGLTRATIRRVGPGLLAVAAATSYERNLWLLALPAARLAVDAARAARTERVARLLDAAAVFAGAGVLAGYLATLSWTPWAAARALTAGAYWQHPLNAVSLPLACTDAIANVPDGTRVFTSRTWASYVIWRVPAARVFIDGRNREYPVELHRVADAVFRGEPGAAEVLARSGTEWVIARPGWGETEGVRGAGWRAVVADRGCGLFRRVER